MKPSARPLGSISSSEHVGRQSANDAQRRVWAADRLIVVMIDPILDDPVP